MVHDESQALNSFSASAIPKEAELHPSHEVTSKAVSPANNAAHRTVRRQAMRIETHGQQIEVTPAMREYVESKFKRLERHFDQPLEVRAQLGIRKPDYLAEATLTLAGRTLHADAGAETMYAAIDILADKLDRLLLKHKQKKIDKERGPRGENAD
jgi:putative sigma-54 modulation protein